MAIVLEKKKPAPLSDRQAGPQAVGETPAPKSTQYCDRGKLGHQMTGNVRTGR